jgi:hypothetical protein
MLLSQTQQYSLIAFLTNNVRYRVYMIYINILFSILTGKVENMWSQVD